MTFLHQFISLIDYLLSPFKDKSLFNVCTKSHQIIPILNSLNVFVFHVFVIIKLIKLTFIQHHVHSLVIVTRTKDLNALVLLVVCSWHVKFHEQSFPLFKSSDVSNSTIIPQSSLPTSLYFPKVPDSTYTFVPSPSMIPSVDFLSIPYSLQSDNTHNVTSLTFP